MCGIAGLIPPKQQSVEPDLVAKLLLTMRHRGPDDHGYLIVSTEGVRSGREWRGQAARADAILLHCRLAIIDLSKAGWQPMSSADGRYHVVFNGEIYNYVELRRELESLGCTFRSQSDTEVLLTAYVRWGRLALNRLVGMFAFAILDVGARNLFLARDCFGIKPLFYGAWHDGFAFASEITTLLALPGVPRRAAPQQVYQYLRRGRTDHDASTLLAGISQLPAAHYVEVSLDSPQVSRPVRYWDTDRGGHLDISFGAAAARLRELFLDSIRLHLRSDVPIGVSLSGGIDSSSILMAMRHLLGTKHEIHAFSFVTDHERLGEEKWVDLIGEEAKAVVHKVRLRPDELVGDLDRLIAVQGEPFGSTSIYAQYRVFELAREAGVKVLVDGQGADELLGGYRYCISARLASLIRQQRWREVLPFISHAASLPGVSTSTLLFECGALSVPKRLQSVVRKAPDWLNVKWFRDHAVDTAISSFVPDTEVLRAWLHGALTETSLPHLLRYEDRNSMAHSIESRVPFITPAISSFLRSLPEEHLIAPDGTSKAVFRQAMSGLVPGAVLARRDKIGFATPERQWLASLRPWVERVLKSEAASGVPAIEIAAAEREWKSMLGSTKTFGAHVWRWLNLIEWSRAFDVRFDA